MLRKLARYTKGYGIYILLGVLCSVGESVLELELPQAMSEIVDVGIANGDRSYILLTGLKMFLMAIAALLCGVGAAALAAKASMGFGANLRQAEYEQVQRFSFANIEHFSTASLITRLTNDISSVQMTLFMGMRMCVRAPVMLVTALIKAMEISLDLSQVFLVVIPLLVIAVAIVIRYVAAERHRRPEPGGAGKPERRAGGEVLRPGGPGEGEIPRPQRQAAGYGGAGLRLRGHVHARHGHAHGRHHRVPHVVGRPRCGGGLTAVR